jgi:eukaryotic-like serine/threonine-protein kinase
MVLRDQVGWITLNCLFIRAQRGPRLIHSKESVSPCRTRKAPITALEAVTNETLPGSNPLRQRAHGGSTGLRAGSVLQNRYRILEVLGVGGMSTVYRARDLRFTSVDRSCAVKEMFNSAEDAKLRQIRYANFQREAALLATLTHAAIPRIFDYFEQQGTIYLILEHIRGQDLETMLTKRDAPFDETVLIDWAIRLCDVLSYLHGQLPEPIVFRDLKPSNLMIRAEDSALMLVDFGIARSFAPQQKGTMIGTEGYAPPEQYKGISDARGDVYALGATLHHLGTGSDPRMETPFTFADRPPRKINPMLSEGFEQIVQRCVSYEASERFASASDVRLAFEALRAPRAVNVAPELAAPAVEQLIKLESPALISTTAKPAPDRLDWRLKTEDEVRGSASYAGGAVYVGSYDHRLYAIDETDGTVRWAFTAQRGIVSRPAPIAEMVIFGCEDKNVYAVSRMSGRAIWTFRTNMPVRSSATVDEQWVYIGSDDGFLYRLDRIKGVASWRYKTWGPVRSSAARVGDLAIFGSDDGYLYAVQVETGQLHWRAQIGSPVMSSPAVVGEIVIVGAGDGVIRAFAIGDGNAVWRHAADKTVIASPAIVDSTVYIGSADGHLYALAAETGKAIWKTRVCRQITSTAAIDDSVIYVGGNDATISCLDRASGEVSWRYATGGAVVAKPLVTHDHIIFGSLDGSVRALNRAF